MVTLYYTQLFTSGTLEGLTYDGSLTFVSEQAAQEWLAVTTKGVKRSTYTPSAYKVVEWRIEHDGE